MTNDQDEPEVPPSAERLMPPVDAVPRNEVLVLSNSRGVPLAMYSPGSENIVTTMPFVAAAGGGLAVAAAVGSVTGPASPSETAAASSQRVLLSAPATAAFPPIGGFR